MPYKFKVTWLISFNTKQQKGLIFEDSQTFVNLTQATKHTKELKLHSINSNIELSLTI
jgi:hypothetical protein